MWNLGAPGSEKLPGAMSLWKALGVCVGVEMAEVRWCGYVTARTIGRPWRDCGRSGADSGLLQTANEILP